jgi:hypothetical protein
VSSYTGARRLPRSGFCRNGWMKLFVLAGSAEKAPINRYGFEARCEGSRRQIRWRFRMRILGVTLGMLISIFAGAMGRSPTVTSAVTKAALLLICVSAVFDLGFGRAHQSSTFRHGAGGQSRTKSTSLGP